MEVLNGTPRNQSTAPSCCPHQRQSLAGSEGHTLLTGAEQGLCSTRAHQVPAGVLRQGSPAQMWKAQEPINHKFYFQGEAHDLHRS